MRIVSWLPPIPADVASLWLKLSVSPWMCFIIDGHWNGHFVWACYVDYSFHKTNINLLKLIVTAQINFVQDFYHQLRSRVIMKQFSQSNMKQIVFLSIMLSIMDDLKYSVTFTMNVHGFGLMRKQSIDEPLPWLRTACSVCLIADITVFRWIVFSCNTRHAVVQHIPWWCLLNTIFL